MTAARGRNPLYLRARTLVDPETGEEVLALVPATHTDREHKGWKRTASGDRVRAELTRPRNPGFHRLAHALGKVVSENIEDFDHLDAHDTLKRLQLECGVECDMAQIDAGSAWAVITDAVVTAVPETKNVMPMIGERLHGHAIPMRWPRSLAFDSMDEESFQALMQSICKWISARYWPDCSPEEIASMAELYVGATHG